MSGRARAAFFFGLAGFIACLAIPVVSYVLLCYAFSSQAPDSVLFTIFAYSPLVLIVLSLGCAVTGLVLAINALKRIASLSLRGRPLAILAIVFSGMTLLFFTLALVMLF